MIEYSKHKGLDEKKCGAYKVFTRFLLATEDVRMTYVPDYPNLLLYSETL